TTASAPNTYSGPGGNAAAANGLPVQGVRGGRGTAELWAEPARTVSARRGLRRQDPQGGEASRSSRRAADEARASDQPQDRKGARADDPALGAGAGGRDHRVVRMLKNRKGALQFPPNGGHYRAGSWRAVTGPATGPLGGAPLTHGTGGGEPRRML